MRNVRAILSVALILVVTGCATPSPPPDLLAGLRSDLEALEAQPEIRELAPRALADARNAVRRAAADALDPAARSQRVWLARKTIELARASSFAEQARREVEALDRERSALLLTASRIEAEQARAAAEQALLESVATEEEMNRARRDAMSAEESRALAARQAEQAREETDQVRRLAEAQATEIELARREADLASATAQSLQRRLEYMEYRQTDRGVVVTLGDVLFEVGETTLLDSAEESLRDVITLLESEPDKPIRIEGHTDATGPAELNLRISRERAEAVAAALAELGIDAARIDAVGMGEDFPIASNETNEGRARNRRVDVIVLND